MTPLRRALLVRLRDAGGPLWADSFTERDEVELGPMLVAGWVAVTSGHVGGVRHMAYGLMPLGLAALEKNDE